MIRLLRPSCGASAALAALLLVWACSAGLPPPAQIQSAAPEELAALESRLRARLGASERDPQVLHLLSRVLMRQERLEEAEQLALEATQRAPFRADLLRGLGEAQLARGERFRAALAFTQAVRVDPQDLEAYLLLGRVRNALGETDAAKTALGQAIRIEPDYFEARVELARVLLDAGDPASALEQVAAARRIRPTSPQALLLHVSILKARGFLSDAQFVAERALRNDLAGLETARGEPALRVDEVRPELLRELMDIHRQREEWPQLEALLERLSGLGEPTVADQLVRADWMEGTGDAVGAAILRAELLRRKPREPAVLVASARGLLAKNEPREALRALETAIQEAPNWAELHYWEAVAHYALGQDLEGDLALGRAERLQAAHTGARLLRVRRLIARHQLSEAASRLASYVQDRPADSEGLLLQAELNTLMGNYAYAERVLGFLPPDDPGVRFARGRLEYMRGRYRGALEALAPLTALPAPPWEAVYLEAAALSRLDRPTDALEKVRLFLDRDGAGASFYRLAGSLAHQAGDTRGAERFYTQGLRRFPRDPGLLEGASRLAVERKAWREARNWLEEAVEREGPFHVLMLERLAVVYRELGEAERAREVLRRYLEATDPLIREVQEPTEPAILYRMTLPALKLAMRPP
jgi:tetratricopeptide (TPR) repeat protein